MNRSTRRPRVVALMSLGLLAAGALLAGNARAATGLAVICTGAAGPSCSPHKYDLPDAASVVHSGGAFKIFNTLADTDTVEVCSADIPKGSASDSNTGAPCTKWAYVPKSSFAAVSGVLALLTVSWVLPTAATDGTPLVGEQALTAIQLYVSSAPIPDDFAGAPTATFAGDMVQAVYNGTVPNGATLYVRVKAVNRGGTSAFSAQASKLIEVPIAAPGAPTDVTVQFRIVPKQ